MATFQSRFQVTQVRPVDKLMNTLLVLEKIVKNLEFKDQLSLLFTSKQWSIAVRPAFRTRKHADLQETVNNIIKFSVMFGDQGKSIPKRLTPAEDIALGLEWIRVNFPALKQLRTSFSRKSADAVEDPLHHPPVNFSLAYARSLAGIRDLESLEIRNFLVDQAGSLLAIRELLRILAPRLRELILELPVCQEQFKESLGGMVNLEKLELELPFCDIYQGHNQIEASWFEIFQKLPAPEKIKFLGIRKYGDDLTNRNRYDIDKECLGSFPPQFLSKYVNLEGLSIGKIQLGRDAARNKAILESIPKTLKKLDLHCKIPERESEAGANALFEFFKDMENLEHLKVEIDGSGTQKILLGITHGCINLRSLQYRSSCPWCFDRVMVPTKSVPVGRRPGAQLRVRVPLDWSLQEQLKRENVNIVIQCGGKECKTCKRYCCQDPLVLALGLETLAQEKK